jgi:hypothetical protein
MSDDCTERTASNLRAVPATDEVKQLFADMGHSGQVGISARPWDAD